MQLPPLAVSAVIASDDAAAALAPLVGDPAPPTYPSCAAFLADGDPQPGLVLVDPTDGLGPVAELARSLRERGEGWVVALLDRDPAPEWTVRPLTVGYRQDLRSFLAATRGESDDPVLELTPVLARIARARHDINNPLTSALAETQLLLMDVGDPEVRAGLEAIERQIRRIRNLVAELADLRPPG